MTEPIKLPPDVITSRLVMEGINKHVGRNIEQWVNEQFSLAVEQATADLRERLARAEALAETWKNEAMLCGAHQGIDNHQRLLDRIEKAEAERNEVLKATADLRAELTREGSLREQVADDLARVIQRAEKAEAERDEARAALIGLWRTSRKYAADMDDDEYAAFRFAEELVAKLPPVKEAP